MGWVGGYVGCFWWFDIGRFDYLVRCNESDVVCLVIIVDCRYDFRLDIWKYLYDWYWLWRELFGKF